MGGEFLRGDGLLRGKENGLEHERQGWDLTLGHLAREGFTGNGFRQSPVLRGIIRGIGGFLTDRIRSGDLCALGVGLGVQLGGLPGDFPDLRGLRLGFPNRQRLFRRRFFPA